MQLLLVRHAQPVSSHGHADPELSELGAEQAERLIEPVTRQAVARVVSSPQRRAIATGEPTAAKLGAAIDIDERLAEYDRDFPGYTPFEDIEAAQSDEYQRILAGDFPSMVDAPAFLGRISAAVEDIVAAADHRDTVVVFAHGGVINGLLHRILGTRKPLAFPLEYCSISSVLYSRSGRVSVAGVNAIDHVRDLLPRYR